MSSSDASVAIANKAPELWAVIIVFLMLCYIVVGLRCYVRFGILGAFWFDDLAAIASLASHVSPRFEQV